MYTPSRIAGGCILYCVLKIWPERKLATTSFAVSKTTKLNFLVFLSKPSLLYAVLFFPMVMFNQIVTIFWVMHLYINTKDYKIKALVYV